jgi:hypothetical protein
MPPRRSAHGAAVVERESTVLSLPHALLLLIFALLPVDMRARCACVCRAWRAALSERSLWVRLDLSRTSGVTRAVTDALLRGAAARAGGALETLDVSGCLAVSVEALLAVATANAGTLRELRMRTCTCLYAAAAIRLSLDIPSAEALLRAAPQLRVLEADVHCNDVPHARHALRAEGLMTPLCVHGLWVDATGDATEADILDLCALVASHASLQQLCVSGALWTPAALDAVVNAARARHSLTSLFFVNCGLSPASAPVLVRLLGGSAVDELHVYEGGRAQESLLDTPAAELLAGALRANTTLTSLRLAYVHLWDDPQVAAILLGALATHPSLRSLDISCNVIAQAADRVAAGAALGALVAADPPALTTLNIAYCLLHDAGLRPLFEALPRNTHLRTLNCADNLFSLWLAANVLLPAVRANASLRALTTNHRFHSPGELEAMEIVSRRVAAHI